MLRIPDGNTTNLIAVEGASDTVHYKIDKEHNHIIGSGNLPVAIHGTYKSDDGKTLINIVNGTQESVKIKSKRNTIIIAAGGSLTLINSSITIGSEETDGCALKVYGHCIIKNSIINVNSVGAHGVLSLEDKCTLIENSHIDCCKPLTLNYQVCNSIIKTSNTVVPTFIDVPVFNSSITVIRGMVKPYVSDKLVADYQFTSLTNAHVKFVYDIPASNPEKIKSLMNYYNTEVEEQKIILEGTAKFDIVGDNKIIMKHLMINSMHLNAYSLNAHNKGTMTKSKDLSADSISIDTDIINVSPIDIVRDDETITFANENVTLGYFECNTGKHELTSSEIKLFGTETNSAISNGKIYGKGSYDLQITDDENDCQITSKTCVSFSDLICNK